MPVKKLSIKTVYTEKVKKEMAPFARAISFFQNAYYLL